MTSRRRNSTLTSPPIQADAAWKRALERWFQPFMSFFWPDIAAKIDWTAPIESLDQELLPFMTASQVGKRLVDKVFKVRSRAGQPYFILLHLEVQSDGEANFSVRLFEYSYKLYDKYKLPVLTLAVLADDSASWRPAPYTMEVWGHPTHRFDFQSVKLLDWKGQEDALLEQDNPFGVITAIHLRAQATRKDTQARLDTKFETIRRLYEKGYGREEICGFYEFMDGVMRLPRDLEIRYYRHIQQLEQVKGVDYITSAEQFGIEKGMQARYADVWQTAEQTGEQRKALAIARKMLAEDSPIAFVKLVTDLPEEEIEELARERD